MAVAYRNAAAALVLGAMLTVPVATLADITGVTTVIDGDTLEIHGERIRLYGVDAPESGQTCTAEGAAYRCGQEAALLLAEMIGRSPVTCRERDTDRYGRVVAVCYQGDLDLNAWLVENGLALAYSEYSSDYADEEERARVEGRGLWRGQFVEPWDWRRGERLPAEGRTATSGTLYVDGDRVNLRAGPSTNTQALGQLSRGDPVEELDRRGDWIKVRDPASGLEGWISGRYVKAGEAPAHTVGRTLPPPPPAVSSSPSRACCKVCSKGQPCGDSCISQRYTCHKPPGCAC